jgi:hypothetical protein
MKKLLLFLSLIGWSADAAIVDFNLSPPGTGSGVGLSPLNEVPPVTNSIGSGGALPPGIFLNTVTRELGFTMGYGSSAGFTDLTAPASALHFHAPAPAGSNAGVIINLQPYHLPAPNPALGGQILGIVTLTTNQVDFFLNGLVYVNVHTTNFPGGEIRGQVIPVATNLPPVLVCPAPTNAECATVTTLTATVSDAEGDAIEAIWSANGAALQTNSVPAGLTNGAFAFTLTGSFPLGTNVLSLSATDRAGNISFCTSTLVVVDTTPPVIVSVDTAPRSLWPPNHKLISVPVSVVATDACSTVTWKITSVASNQHEDGLGDGKTKPDWMILSDHKLKLRAERSGKDGERIYTINITAMDASSNQANASITVNVPHDRSGVIKKHLPAPAANSAANPGNPGNSSGSGTGKGKAKKGG